MNDAKPRLANNLRSTPMFSALDDAALRDLLSNCQQLSRPAGTMIFTDAEPAERFFVILAGKVKVFKLSAKGDQQILHLYGPGETFGEAAMWAGMNYPACAEAVTDVTLLAVSRQTLRRLIARNADLAVGMIVGMSAKLREFADLIEQLSLKPVPARLASALLDLSRQAGSSSFRLPQTKRQLAAQIGTAPATLSRALARLSAAGCIAVDGRKITILRPDDLARLAESAYC